MWVGLIVVLMTEARTAALQIFTTVIWGLNLSKLFGYDSVRGRKADIASVHIESVSVNCNGFRNCNGDFDVTEGGRGRPSGTMLLHCTNSSKLPLKICLRIQIQIQKKSLPQSHQRPTPATLVSQNHLIH